MKTDKNQIFIVGNDEASCSALESLLTAFGVQVDSFIPADSVIAAA